MRKNIAGIVLAASIGVGVVCGTGCSVGTKGSLTIVDEAGTAIAVVEALSDERKELVGNAQRAYAEAALSECETVMAERYGCSVEKARRRMLESECVLATGFNSIVSSAVENAYRNLESDSLAFGCAVTDLQGTVLALYSAGENEEGFYNHATEATPPYSSFKPLCVYTPAVEEGEAVWSSVFLDAPVKKLIGKDGKPSDWPANANGIYSYESTSLADALKVSLNTVAVRCMQQLTVKKSLQFMEDTWNLSLPYEKEKEEQQGENEVIGNVALGYLNGGISPLDMAGYYQVFANGGVYTKPHTVLKITDKEGNILYEYQSESRQVIKNSTANIMNRLLQNVLSAGGTGEKAACDGIPVGGKTGTGDMGNWFVGFTPNYTCAVWHGTALTANHACEVFADAVRAFPAGDKKVFPSCAGMKKAAYCCESGMLLSGKCRKVDMGYFSSDAMPEVCNIHN